MTNTQIEKKPASQDFEYAKMQKHEGARFQTELRKLSQVNGLKAFWPIILNWSVIAAAITLSVLVPNPLVYIISAILIARSQHAVMVMIHEAAHYRLAKSRTLNEIISNYFAAFPVFFCTVGYRLNHMKHHKFLNTSDDPDWMRKVHLPEWQFPQTKMQIAKTGVKIFLTSWYKLAILFYAFSGIGSRKTYQTADGRLLLAQKAIFYAVTASTLVHFGLVKEFFLYWAVPFFFVLPLIERVRSISEHFGLTYADQFSQTRNVLCSPVEAFLFGPHNIRYHLVHHLYPTVPQYNLPKLFELLNEDVEFKTRAHNNTGYFLGGEKSLFWDLQNVRPEVSKEALPKSA